MIENWSELKFWDTPGYKKLVSKLVCDPKCKYIPSADIVTRAFDLTKPREIKAVIIGQDPYHTPGVADGLAFSTWPNNTKIPPSLRNIFKEYHDDLGLPLPRSGDLSSWAGEGVLLLNTCLTTEPGKAGAHRGKGWEKLTIEVIQTLSERGHCCFILWGRDAGEYGGLVDESFAGYGPKNHVVRSSHPSPFSARQSFFGSKPFSRCNKYLDDIGMKPINWKLR